MTLVFSLRKIFLLLPLRLAVFGFAVVAVGGFRVVQPVLLACLPSIV